MHIFSLMKIEVSVSQVRNIGAYFIWLTGIYRYTNVYTFVAWTLTFLLVFIQKNQNFTITYNDIVHNLDLLEMCVFWHLWGNRSQTSRCFIASESPRRLMNSNCQTVVPELLIYSCKYQSRGHNENHWAFWVMLSET